MSDLIFNSLIYNYIQIFSEINTPYLTFYSITLIILYIFMNYCFLYNILLLSHQIVYIIKL